jgi:hypothetical protein
MNNLVSIVYLIDDSFLSTSTFDNIYYSKGLKNQEFDNAENILVNKVCELEVEIVVGYDLKSDVKAIEHFKKIADKLIEVENVKDEANAYNLLFKNCTNDYVCVLKKNCFLENGWLNELIAYSKLIDKVGCISIVSNYIFCEYISILSSDMENMVGVYLPQQEFFDVFGVLFFDRQHLYLIGALDSDTKIKNYVWEQWQMRCARLGFNNFAIPTQSCIYFPNASTTDKTDWKNVIDSIEEMRKVKSFYIPL